MENVIFQDTQFNSVQSSRRVRLCNPMDCSTPGLPVHHQLPTFTQTHVHRVSDAIQPSHSLSSLSPPAFNILRFVLFVIVLGLREEKRWVGKRRNYFFCCFYSFFWYSVSHWDKGKTNNSDLYLLNTQHCINSMGMWPWMLASIESALCHAPWKLKLFKWRTNATRGIK